MKAALMMRVLATDGPPGYNLLQANTKGHSVGATTVNDGSAQEHGASIVAWIGSRAFPHKQTFVGEACESLSDFGTGVPAYM
jgi:hypothetical protein